MIRPRRTGSLAAPALALALLCLAARDGAAGEPPFQLKPAVLRPEKGEQWAAGLEAKLALDRMPSTAEDVQVGYRLDADLAVTTRKRFDPENLSLSAHWGFLRDLRKVTPVPAGTELDPDRMRSPVIEMGSFDGGLEARYETDQTLEEQVAFVSASAGFVRTSSHYPWAALPSVALYADWLEPTKSERASDADQDLTGFGRFRLEASLQLPMPYSEHRTFLSPLALAVDFRLFRALGEPPSTLEDAHDAEYFAADLIYQVDTPRLSMLRDVYLRYSDGALPPSPDPGRAVRLGFTLAPSRAAR